MLPGPRGVCDGSFVRHVIAPGVAHLHQVPMKAAPVHASRAPRFSRRPFPRPSAVNYILAQRLYNLAEWWHLLSLDAPTVAALWSWFFARAMHLHLPLIPPLL